MNIHTINAAGIALRKHQTRMFDMLVYIDKICQDNDIRYCLSDGTLLGAVRHKGFIPWDGDLDTVFLKKDLDRLYSILLKEQDATHLLQANDTDSNYIALYEKLRLNSTSIQENNDSDHLYKYGGIYINLFYLEPAPPFFHIIFDRAQTRLVNLVKDKRTTLRSWTLRGWGSTTRSVLYPCFSFTSSLFSPEYLSYPLGSYFHTQFRKEWLFPLKELEFEREQFYVPSNYREMLRAQYGDYTRIPSEEEITTYINFTQFED